MHLNRFFVSRETCSPATVPDSRRGLRSSFMNHRTAHTLFVCPEEAGVHRSRRDNFERARSTSYTCCPFCNSSPVHRSQHNETSTPVGLHHCAAFESYDLPTSLKHPPSAATALVVSTPAAPTAATVLVNSTPLGTTPLSHIYVVCQMGQEELATWPLWNPRVLAG